MPNQIPDDYVRMQKCFQCGKDTGAILLSQRLKSIPEEQAYSGLCDSCKKLTANMKRFVCKTCNKQGFIKKSALRKLLKPKTYQELKDRDIIGFEKCPVCMGIVSNEQE